MHGGAAAPYRTMNRHHASDQLTAPQAPESAAARILLVEDEPSIAVTLADDLRDGGYEVTSLADGGAAIELLARQPYPVVVTDLRLPGACGYAVMQAARAAAADCRVLVISAHLSGHAEALLRDGAEALLRKPFLNERVLAWLRRLWSGLGSNPAERTAAAPHLLP